MSFNDLEESVYFTTWTSGTVMWEMHFYLCKPLDFLKIVVIIASQCLSHVFQGLTLFFKKKMISIVKIASRTLWDKYIFKEKGLMCQAELWIFITTPRLLPRVFYHSLFNNSILSFNGECLIVNLVGFDYDYAVVCHEVIFFYFFYHLLPVNIIWINYRPFN